MQKQDTDDEPQKVTATAIGLGNVDNSALKERELSLWVCLGLLLILVFLLVPDDVAERIFWIAVGWFVLFAVLARDIELRMRFILYAVVSVVIAMIIRVI